MIYKITASDILGKKHHCLWNAERHREYSVQSVIEYIKGGTAKRAHSQKAPFCYPEIIAIITMTAINNYVENRQVLTVLQAIVKCAKSTQPTQLTKLRTLRSLIFYHYGQGTSFDLDVAKALMMHMVMISYPLDVTSIEQAEEN